MITVNILINGKPIFTRSAVNIKYNKDGTCSYRLDTGKLIKHKRQLGATELAIDMLKTIDKRVEEGK